MFVISGWLYHDSLPLEGGSRLQFERGRPHQPLPHEASPRMAYSCTAQHLQGLRYEEAKQTFRNRFSDLT